MVVVKQDAMPIVTASLLVDAGAEHEPLAKSGLASLTGSLLSEGTRSLSGPELAERMERLGAQLQTGSAYTMAFVVVTGLKATFPEALTADTVPWMFRPRVVNISAAKYTAP